MTRVIDCDKGMRQEGLLRVRNCSGVRAKALTDGDEMFQMLTLFVNNARKTRISGWKINGRATQKM